MMKRALVFLAGLGAAASACSTKPSVPLDLPGPPSAVVAAASIRSATVRWNPPSSGGGPITAYAVLVSPSAPSAAVTLQGTTAVVNGLANGTTYRFQVTATNAGGTGPASAASSPVTTLDVPGAPTALAAVGGDGSATLTWNGPASDGGSPVTGYAVVISPAAQSALVAVQGTRAAITNLANGTSYSFRVVATNAVGAGPSSAPSGAVTPGQATAIALTPSPLSVPAGSSRQLYVVASSPGGSPSDVTGRAQWATGNPAVATVAGGLVTAVAPGSTTVTATVGTVSQTVTVRVAAVTSLTIFPRGTSFPRDRAVQLAAIAAFDDGSHQVVTSDASWISADPTSVRVTGGKLSAASGASTGASASISASYRGVGAAPVTATVLAAASPIGPGVDADPLLPAQWHLHNTGQTAYAQNGGVAGNDVSAMTSWGSGLGGRGVKVAVVDSGLEIAHEDLAGNVAPGSWNFVTATTDPTSTATTGDHGTSVGGLIAAVRANGKGGMGVAPTASLNGYNYIESQTSANWVASMGAGNGVGGPRAFDAWIFNQSFGMSDTAPFAPSSARVDQYLDGVTNLRGGLGAIYVKAAGNGFGSYDEVDQTPPDCSAANAAGVTCENANMDPYNTLPMNVVVAAFDADGQHSSYSSAGPAIWISAPGGEFGLSAPLVCPTSTQHNASCPAYYFEPAMITTDQSGCAAGYATSSTIGSPFDEGTVSANASCNYTNGFNGTSSAAPVVAGAIALLLEANPALTWRDVKHILASTARPLDTGIAPVTRSLPDGSYTLEPGWTTNAAGYRFHDWYGFGAVHVDAAVAMALAYAPGTLPAWQDTGWLPGIVRGAGTIPDASVAGALADAVVLATPNLRVEAVQVRVSTDHGWLGDLGIELTSPSGTRSVLLNALNGFGASSGTVTIQLLSNAFYGEPSAGTWTLKVVDVRAGNTGKLASANGTAPFQIRIYGHGGAP